MNVKTKYRELKNASPAEILRSHQRDNDFITQLRQRVAELLQGLGNQRTLFPIIYSDIPFKLIYYFFTTAMGNQTLGEEYTGIVQANLHAYKVPSVFARTIAVILECFGEKTLLRLLRRLELSTNSPNSKLTPAAVTFFNSFISMMRTMIPILIIMHKGLFYMFGKYYSLGRRIVGIDYIKVYGHRLTNSVNWGLRLLGIATLIHCALKLWQCQHIDDQVDKHLIINGKQDKLVCQLCLEKTPTTATPCGHVFCWYCVTDWLHTKAQCPLCREHVKPSRIVYVWNL